MDNEEDGAREYERLRAELADFVLDALAQKVASGEQPQLSQAIADAIDRRVEHAVAAQVGQAQFPDPDTFADQVIAAVAARGYVGGEPSRVRSRATPDAAPARRPAGMSIGSFSRLHIILIGIIIVIIGAGITYLILNRGSTPTRSETVNNVTFITPEPTPDGSTNVQTPPVNGIEPAPPVRNETRRR